MSRWQANLLILITALIWGTTFVAQQTGMQDVGAFYFTGIRFALGTLVVAPLALREWRRLNRRGVAPDRRMVLAMGLSGVFLFLGSLLQQIGLGDTTVGNAAFLTAIYVPLVPMLGWVLFRLRPHPVVWPAAAGCVVGTYLIGGGDLAALRAGDLWVLSSALFWGLQVLTVGIVAQRSNAPLTLATVQFAVTAVLGLAGGMMSEPLSVAAVMGAGVEILYAGVLSVGLAFTFQAVGQNYTQPADAAIIMSSEAVFGAAAGAVILGERLSLVGMTGAGLILLSIVMVQLVPLLRRARARARAI